MTAAKQSDRKTVPYFVAELEQLIQALSGNLSRLTADLWAEELISRVAFEGYEFDQQDGESYIARARAWRRVVIAGDERRRQVTLRFTNEANEAVHRSSDRLWNAKLMSARQILESAEWTIERGTRYSGRTIILSASVAINILEDRLIAVAGGLERALSEVSLD